MLVPHLALAPPPLTLFPGTLISWETAGREGVPPCHIGCCGNITLPEGPLLLLLLLTRFGGTVALSASLLCSTTIRRQQAGGNGLSLCQGLRPLPCLRLRLSCCASSIRQQAGGLIIGWEPAASGAVLYQHTGEA